MVAQVDDPYSRRNEGMPPLKIGQFVEAEIEGKRLEKTIVIPHGSIYQGNEVVLVEQGKVQRKPVNALWSDAQQAVINKGLDDGDILVLTSVGSVTSGTPISAIIDGKKAERKRNKKGGVEEINF